MFEGKRVLVTGGCVGIGACISKHMRSLGAIVYPHYCNEVREGEQARALLAALKQDKECPNLAAEFCPHDFSDVQQINLLAECAVRNLRGIDVLVNNSGITLDTALTNVSSAHMELLYRVNVMAPLLLIRLLAPNMEHLGGSIINISSIHSFGGVPGYSVYAGTKGAVNATTRALAIELAPKKIRVNAISPGGIEVPRQKELDPNHDPAAFGRLVPLGRIGNPQDIANAVEFLTSEKASYITGQVMCVDGGATAAMAIGNACQRVPDVPLANQPYLT